MTMTPTERATRLVNDWLEQTRGMPVTTSMARLGVLVTGAIQDAEEAERQACAALCERRATMWQNATSYADKVVKEAKIAEARSCMDTIRRGAI
jgi:hypothetical protein